MAFLGNDNRLRLHLGITSKTDAPVLELDGLTRAPARFHLGMTQGSSDRH